MFDSAVVMAQRRVGSTRRRDEAIVIPPLSLGGPPEPHLYSYPARSFKSPGRGREPQTLKRITTKPLLKEKGGGKGASSLLNPPCIPPSPYERPMLRLAGKKVRKTFARTK